MLLERCGIGFGIRQWAEAGKWESDILLKAEEKRTHPLIGKYQIVENFEGLQVKNEETQEFHGTPALCIEDPENGRNGEEDI